MCRRNNCIEVRLIEQEDVKQQQYWEFINGPHFLHLINNSLPKNVNKNFPRSKHGNIIILACLQVSCYHAPPSI